MNYIVFVRKMNDYDQRVPSNKNSSRSVTNESAHELTGQTFHSSIPHYLELACPKRGSKPPLLWVLKSLSNRCLFRNSRGIVVDTKFISNFLSWKSPLKPSLVGESNILKSVKSYSVLWSTAGKVQGTLSYHDVIRQIFYNFFWIDDYWF